MSSQQQPPQPKGTSIDESIQQKKLADFERELVELQAKYGYMIIPVQHLTKFGTMLDLAYMPKEQFDKQMKAGLMASGATITQN